MPAKSQAQGDLMRAAEHGANFPMARKVRDSMTPNQMHDFAVTKTANKPEHVGNSHPHKNLGRYIYPKKGR